jgi:amino acid adenylation domain-containing protein
MTMTDVGVLEENLFTLFAHQAVRRPDAPAVLDHTGTTSYAALAARACVIADALTQQGLAPEQPVGVLMHRTSDLLATLLGILRAGGCYVPLDPDDPPERTRRIVTGAGCELVLGHKPLLAELRSDMRAAADPAEPFVLLDVERFAAASAVGAGSESPDPRSGLPHLDPPGGHRLAYVLFTSGSTGTPKGVEVEHRSVVNLLLAARHLFGFTESDRYLATSTVGFDISVAELFLPLITGGAVVLRDRELLLDPRRLAEEIRGHGVTVFQTGPSVWSVVLAEVADFPRLRVAISTGEAIAPDLARRLVDVGDAAWNLYGPTEATVWATGHRLERDATGRPVRSSVSAPIGRALANVEVRVLDEKGAPVPAGAEGELWIGGAALARGYRGNERLTRERFVAVGDDGRRFYRTGDVVAEDVDGTLHYFGRNDDQIKVRGVRIEPMEVESAILGHPGVTQAAATWFATASSSRSIVAAVVARPDIRVTAEQLHQHLSRLLPAAMVPSRFVFCAALPLSPSGKVDRNAIRARAAEMPAETAAAPSRGELTETERTLVRIWERTLGIGPVTRNDHFFTIGGDSLSAVTMMLHVESAFEVSLAVRVVFEAPTLDRLAARIDRARSQPDALGNAEFIFPLAQQGRGTPVFFSSVDLKLARKGTWSADCPLYAVSQWAQGSGFAKARSVEELARVHIDGIRSIQPRGPYRLAGYSFGGLIALEIAQQLRRAGETIELLFLLDPSEPFTTGDAPHLLPHDPSATGARETPGARIMRHVCHVAENPRDIVSYVGTRARATAKATVAWQWLSYHLVHFHGRHPNPVSARLLPKNRWPVFWYTAKRLGGSYVPQPYDGDALAVFLDQKDRHAAWRLLLGPTADIRIVESTHPGLFAEPALSQWLQVLRARLDGAP